MSLIRQVFFFAQDRFNFPLMLINFSIWKKQISELIQETASLAWYDQKYTAGTKSLQQVTTFHLDLVFHQIRKFSSLFHKILVGQGDNFKLTCFSLTLNCFLSATKLSQA